MKHEHPKIIRARRKIRDRIGKEWIERAAIQVRDEIDSEIMEQLGKIYNEKKTITP